MHHTLKHFFLEVKRVAESTQKHDEYFSEIDFRWNWGKRKTHKHKQKQVWGIVLKIVYVLLGGHSSGEKKTLTESPNNPGKALVMCFVVHRFVAAHRILCRSVLAKLGLGMPYDLAGCSSLVGDSSSVSTGSVCIFFFSGLLQHQAWFVTVSQTVAQKLTVCKWQVLLSCWISQGQATQCPTMEPSLWQKKVPRFQNFFPCKLGVPRGRMPQFDLV